MFKGDGMANEGVGAKHFSVDLNDPMASQQKCFAPTDFGQVFYRLCNWPYSSTIGSGFYQGRTKEGCYESRYDNAVDQF